MYFGPQVHECVSFFWKCNDTLLLTPMKFSSVVNCVCYARDKKGLTPTILLVLREVSTLWF